MPVAVIKASIQSLAEFHVDDGRWNVFSRLSDPFLQFGDLALGRRGWLGCFCCVKLQRGRSSLRRGDEIH